jgi:outer membrane protein assembly factor BamB
MAEEHASTRFSGLEQIADNVSLVWTFSTGVLRGHEAAPIVVGGTPHPQLRPLDLETARGGGPRHIARRACCDVVNRGAAYYDGRIYYNTLDNHTIAVDAETGAEVWKHAAGRHQPGREHDDGAPRREREGAGRQQWRRVRRARLAHGAGCGSRRASYGVRTAPARTVTC